MNHTRRLFLLCFIESFACVLLQRGIYFYTHSALGFTQADNLWLALLYGVTYVAGAFASHPLAARAGERWLIVATLGVLVVAHTALALHPSVLVVGVGFAVVSVAQGLKWPVVESFISAGAAPEDLLRLLGRYNGIWASSVPLALAASGPIIASGSPALLFVLAAALNVVGILLCRGLPARPSHLDAADPVRPDPRTVARYRSLLVSARVAMLGSYTLLFLLAPLMPEIMTRLGLDVAISTSSSAILDIGRLGCFAGLLVYTGWRGKNAPLVLTIVLLPASFLLVLFGHNLPLVLAGELVFGACAGFVYTAALYYALLVKNASVDAGGAHEALIGAGFVVGPGAGLLGMALAGGHGPGSSAYVHSMLVAIVPFIALCTLGAAWPLTRNTVHNPLGL